MTTGHKIEGPFTDEQGEYWTYRRWRLEQMSCWKASDLLGMARHSLDRTMWVAHVPHEADKESIKRVWEAAAFRTPQMDITICTRHVSGDYQYGTPTIESCIDIFEGEVARQFKKNMAAALGGIRK